MSKHKTNIQEASALLLQLTANIVVLQPPSDLEVSPSSWERS